MWLKKIFYILFFACVVSVLLHGQDINTDQIRLNQLKIIQITEQLNESLLLQEDLLKLREENSLKKESDLNLIETLLKEKEADLSKKEQSWVIYEGELEKLNSLLSIQSKKLKINKNIIFGLSGGLIISTLIIAIKK